MAEKKARGAPNEAGGGQPSRPPDAKAKRPRVPNEAGDESHESHQKHENREKHESHERAKMPGA
jgi:hypothetical protein